MVRVGHDDIALKNTFPPVSRLVKILVVLPNPHIAGLGMKVTPWCINASPVRSNEFLILQ